LTKIPEKINNQEQAKHRSGLWIGLVIALVLLVGLMAMGGCTKNSASSKEPSAETVVKNSGGMEFAYVPTGSFQMGSGNGDPNEQPVHQVTFARTPRRQYSAVGNSQKRERDQRMIDLLK
jgi:formylglycine-generating enzyme required for sulfatase activity